MKKESAKGNISYGFMSSDGYFQDISNLNTSNLEYASRSVSELEVLLAEYIETEEYEKCAIIRDEIKKRQAK